MTAAVVYMRCSGRGQIDGDTWDRQLESVHRYAAANDIEIVGEYRDEGISGKTELENRPGLAACLERIENNGVKLVLCESSDRLARDSMTAEIIIREFQKVGGRVIATSGGIDLTEGDDSNPTAKLIRQILAAIAEFDKCVIVLKLRAARKRMKEKRGKCEGRKSFGERPEEKATLDTIIHMNRNQLSADEIADLLNIDKTPTRSGKPWRSSTIRKILARQRSISGQK